MVDKQGKKTPTKTELEHEKLTLEIEKLRRETPNKFWYYLGKGLLLVPLMALIVSAVILYNQIQFQRSREHRKAICLHSQRP